MATTDKFKSKKSRLPLVPPKRQLTRRTKYVQPSEDKTFGISSEDSVRTGLRASSTRGRRARSRRYGKLKFPRVPSNNVPPSCIRHVPKPKCFDREVYLAEDNEEYHVGDSVYIQSDSVSSTYFIGHILEFRTTRKEELLVEIQWFYRPSEVPASVLESLLQDRIFQSKAHQETVTSLLNDPHIRTRELFRCGSTNNGENINLTPASLIRGKCSVRPLSDIHDLNEYSLDEDNFFCTLGFDPITRRLSDFKGEIRVGPSHQAALPKFSPDELYLPSDQFEDNIWNPIHLEDSELQMYLKATRSVALHAGWCLRGRIEDGLMAMQSDSLTQQSYDNLHQSGYCSRTALKSIVDIPNAFDMIYEKTWCREEIKSFQKGIKKFGKQFLKISQEFLPRKSIEDLIKFYYYWKKSPSGLANRNMRKSRKSMHLKKSHLEHVLPFPCLSDLFVDILSSDEPDPIDSSRDSDKNALVDSNEFRLYTCQHCYSSKSHSWHHGGSDNTLLCDFCRVYYCKYAQMRPIPNKSDPPLQILKDPSNFDLIKQINIGRHTIQDNFVDEQVDSSELSEYSDYESNISDIDKVDAEFPRSDPLCNRKNLLMNMCDPTCTALIEVQTSSKSCNSNSFDFRDSKLLNTQGSSRFLDIPKDSIHSQELFPLQNLQISSEIEAPIADDIYQDEHLTNNATLSNNNPSILESLLLRSDEKVSGIRNQMKVICHDQLGKETSTECFEDIFENLESNSNSECSSPDIPKDYYVLLSSCPKQGAARIDYTPKYNICDLIFERKFNDCGEEIYPKSDIIVKHVPKLKETGVFSRKLPSGKVSPTQQSQFPLLTINSVSDQNRNFSSTSQFPSNNIPRIFPTNQGASTISSNIGSFVHSQTNSSVYYSDKPCGESSLSRTQFHKSPQIPISCSTDAQFTNQFFSPISICSTSSSVSNPTLMPNIIQTELSESHLSLAKQVVSQAPILIQESSSPKYSNPDNLIVNRNFPFIPKNLPGSTNYLFPNFPTRINLEQNSMDIQKGTFSGVHQNTQLQPQIQRLNQFDPANISQSFSNTQPQIQSGFQMSSQPISSPSVPLSHRYQNYNNVIVTPVQENRVPVSVGNLLEVTPVNIDPNKLAFQNYIQFLQNQYYQQINALMMSQLQSPTQNIHSQLSPSALQLQLSQLSQVPTQVVPSQNQPSDIPLIPTLPLPGILPYNEIIPQLPNFPFTTERDQNPMLNTSEKK